jgi:hypothetical protein
LLGLLNKATRDCHIFAAELLAAGSRSDKLF